jgi:hypothetical protein
MIVSANGGTPAPLTATPVAALITTEGAHLLPGGDGVLYATQGRIELLRISTGEIHRITEGDTPHFTTSGHLVFARGDNVLVSTFDPVGLALGVPVVLVEGVRRVQTRAFFSVSRNGSVAYVPVEEVASHHVVWVDRQGTWRPVGSVGGGRPLTHPRLAPDGGSMTFQVGNQVITRDLVRGTEEVVGEGSRPIWMPDGRRILVARVAPVGLYIVNGGGLSELYHANSGRPVFPLSWSANGRVLTYSLAHPSTGRDVWTLDVEGTARAFVQSPADERSASLSPDGAWMAYSILEAGRPERVYIERYPEGQRGLVTQSGVEPVWSPLGGELFYRSVDGRELWSVRIDRSTGEIGAPELLFTGPYRSSPTGFWSEYDVSSDGRRFLMVRLEDSAPPEAVHVVLNAIGG